MARICVSSFTNYHTKRAILEETRKHLMMALTNGAYLCMEETLIHVTGNRTQPWKIPRKVFRPLTFGWGGTVEGPPTQRAVRRNDEEHKAVLRTPVAQCLSRRRCSIHARPIRTERAHRPDPDLMLTPGRTLPEPGEKYTFTKIAEEKRKVIQHSGLRRFVLTQWFERRSSGGRETLKWEKRKEKQKVKKEMKTKSAAWCSTDRTINERSVTPRYARYKMQTHQKECDVFVCPAQSIV